MGCLLDLLLPGQSAQHRQDGASACYLASFAVSAPTVVFWSSGLKAGSIWKSGSCAFAGRVQGNRPREPWPQSVS